VIQRVNPEPSVLVEGGRVEKRRRKAQPFLRPAPISGKSEFSLLSTPVS
jgi:hypothetical protein